MSKSHPQTVIVRETHHACSNGRTLHILEINGKENKLLSVEKALDQYLNSHELINSFENVTTCGTIDITVIRVTTFIFKQKVYLVQQSSMIPSLQISKQSELYG